MKLENASAFVTGGGSGLGAATAEALAAAGARVTIFDRDADKANAVAQRLGGIAAVGDVTSEADAQAAFAKAREAHGALRVLVNCAGIGTAARILGREGPMPLDRFETVIRVNLIGTFNMMRLGAAEMAQAEPSEDGERGVIISTASVAAYEGQVGQAAYSASKGGVAALTLPAAREFAGIGVRVLAVAPGLFFTPMMETLPEEVQQSLAASIPFPKRLGRPGEFAALVQHLVDNVHMNGEVVRIDGALRLPPR
ncbi:SDR family NAD(P)-dependent oxidoreductase [Phenylobacterium sp.]|jgi:NAD(P)-dependent dehydrogenase (short-subunit alcohol dehydrogenase family)|uniref:SDR family NAD(P)-dependent oxidoreductase n=1 Tax=Phenylobacterium sp. TaxID=1871053 RepID=UPI00378502BD